MQKVRGAGLLRTSQKRQSEQKLRKLEEKKRNNPGYAPAYTAFLLCTAEVERSTWLWNKQVDRSTSAVQNNNAVCSE